MGRPQFFVLVGSIAVLADCLPAQGFECAK
jgi:hypothetical protein